MSIRIACLIGGLAALTLSTSLMAQDDGYVNIEDDLSTGMQLQELANRAYANADDYWENHPGPVDGDDEELSAGCTSSEHLGPLEPFSKRHFSARTFSSHAFLGVAL